MLRLISLSVLSITAVLAGVGAVQYALQRRQLYGALQADVDAVAARLSTNLAAPIWNVDDVQAFEVLRSELSARHIAAIAVDGDSRWLFVAMARTRDGLAVVKDPAALPAVAASRSFDVRWAGKVVARGRVLYSTDGLTRRLRDLLILTVAQIVLVDLALVVVLVAVLSAWVLRPLRAAEEKFRAAFEVSGLGTVLLDPQGRILEVNASAARMFRTTPEELQARSYPDLVPANSRPVVAEALRRIVDGEVASYTAERIFNLPAGGTIACVLHVSPVHDGRGKVQLVVAVAEDVTERRRLELELRQAQKLEAVGGLAAGIAHEINTPIQYIGDNTHFLEDAFKGLAEVIGQQRRALEACSLPPELTARLAALAEEVDLDYALERVPRTVEATLEGVRRVATIVRAMKEFAHPDQKEMVPVDLNRAIQATLEVARNEYKYVADVETQLGELPPVTCHGGDMNQVILNLVVNAAHAIGEAVKGTGRRGTIRVVSVREGDQVHLSVGDDGTGIPEAVQARIFEPFFTTKEVGRGTGQGLAISRSIVEKHGGAIAFESAVGSGTTFHVRLPVDPAAQAA